MRNRGSSKKSGRVRVHDEQTGAKKCFVSSDITRPRRYLFITELSSHMWYTKSRSLFLMVLFVAEKNAECGADARGLRFPYY